jgi:Ca-activated chloride channel family protein
MNKKLLLIFLSFVLFLFGFSFRTTISNHFIVSKDTLAPVIFHAKDHKAKNVIASKGLMTLTTGLHNDYYLSDSANRIAYLYIETKLERLLNNFEKRLPLNISIVIDRSGSMEGIKMGYAKRAAKGIIDRLAGEDIVSVVMYDTYVDTVQSPVNVIDKEKIKSKIDKISPRSSTNLWGGAEQGYLYVQKKYKPGFINRVLLISDGNANTGLIDSVLIHLKVQKYKDDYGISISTFGVGLDYNETLMTDMAETGAGNYYFIDTPEKMTAIFNNELNGLLNVAAQDAELKIKLPKGITVLKTYPVKYIPNSDEIAIKLRDLSSGETKGILFTFKIDSKTNTELKFTSTLTYTDVMDGEMKRLMNENSLNPALSKDAYLTHFNKQVIEQAILYTSNEQLETAMNLMEKGAYTQAGKFLADNDAYLKANSFYVAKEPMLMKIDSVNRSYSIQYPGAQAISPDSAKKVQKASKAINYRIRNKKQ